MSPRAIAFAALAGLALVVGALVAIPLLIREPVPVARPGAPVALAEGLGPLALSGRILVERDGRFAAILAFPPDQAPRASPRLLLTMPHHDMAPVEPEVRRLDDGRFAASATLHAHGRWTMIVEAGGERQSFDFVAAEF